MCFFILVVEFIAKKYNYYMDIRWIQRLDNFSRALEQLNSAVKLSEERALSDLEIQGVIQAFEYTHELAWNTLKDFLEDRGNQNLYGSRDATREAFKYGLIENGDIWMDMIKSRNRTSHTYNYKTAIEILNLIITDYTSEFNTIYKKLLEFR